MKIVIHVRVLQKTNGNLEVIVLVLLPFILFIVSIRLSRLFVYFQNPFDKSLNQTEHADTDRSLTRLVEWDRVLYDNQPPY